MVRAPCCEKMGLKKGPWTREEDEILVSYIKQFGHGNWRALPKEAGLLRCGKSCRLRWTNYLRPDIRRGNFSKEEEDTIIELHQVLGNRWSAIAARLPGRTDNEIKNVWHTHLKKRLKQFQNQHKLVAMKKQTQAVDQQVSKTHRQAEREEPKAPVNSSMQDTLQSPNSPENSASDISSTAAATTSSDVNGMPMITESFSEVDESFWLDFFSPQNPISSQTSSYIPVVHNNDDPLAMGHACDIYSSVHNDYGIMDFWYNLFIRDGESPELPLLFSL